MVWIVFLTWEHHGGPAFTGYVRAAAEAGMVGGLADLFAVTALFRHPLGLQIPHTAIIPRKKDQLGESLSDFVGENFLVGAGGERQAALRPDRDRVGRVALASRATPSRSPRRPRPWCAARWPCCATTRCRP